MRLIGRVICGFLIAIGAIWILQGVNILPGSFMTGQIVWAWRGAAAVAVGILLLVLIHRKTR
jgi:hypothetical protein